MEVNRLHIQSRREVQDQRRAYSCFSQDKELREALKDHHVNGINDKKLCRTIQRRAKMADVQNFDYWDMSSNLDSQALIEFSRFFEKDFMHINEKEQLRTLEPTCLRHHSYFKGSQLMVSLIRCYTSDDSKWDKNHWIQRQDSQQIDVLLILSEGQGVDLLNSQLRVHLREPPLIIEQDPELSVIGSVMKRFETTGLREWTLLVPTGCLYTSLASSQQHLTAWRVTPGYRHSQYKQHSARFYRHS